MFLYSFLKKKERLYVIFLIYLLYYTHIPCNILSKAYYRLVAELVMGRVCHGPSLYGPSWLWAEFVMGRVCYGPRCPVTPSASKDAYKYSFFLQTIRDWNDLPESLISSESESE